MLRQETDPFHVENVEYETSSQKSGSRVLFLRFSLLLDFLLLFPFFFFLCGPFERFNFNESKKLVMCYFFFGIRNFFEDSRKDILQKGLLFHHFHLSFVNTKLPMQTDNQSTNQSINFKFSRYQCKSM